MPATIDLNCDLGEGAGHDVEIMPWVTSANIACGAHAGDVASMRATFDLAVKHGVQVGAHPGYEDKSNFGRLERPITPREAAAIVANQVGSLAEIAGDSLKHVKLHGALYNQVSRDPKLAAAVCDELQRSWPRLALFALAGSELWRAAASRSMRVASEVFADRTYQDDGTLTARSQADASIADEESVARQVLQMAREGVVRTTTGILLPIVADTVCVHGDGRNAAAFVRRLNRELRSAGIELRAFGARVPR